MDEKDRPCGKDVAQGSGQGTSRIRRLVVISFVLLYCLVGVPLWYRLTTIYRAPLPSDYIRDLHSDPHSDIHLTIPVYVRSDVYKFPDINNAIQNQADALLQSVNSEAGKTVQWSLQILPFEDGKVDLEQDYVVTLVLDEFMGLTMPQLSMETIVFYNDKSVVNNDLPFFVAQALIEHTFKPEFNRFSKGRIEENNMAVSYNPEMHISISLLTGDGYPVSWAIEQSVREYFSPVRDLLSPVVNFTVDTGIEYHNDLNLQSIPNSDSISWEDLSHTLDLSDLSSVNHYKEHNSINLAIVFPSQNTGPLNFINDTTSTISDKADSESIWRSFLVPQWGVVVLNKNPLPANAYVTEEYLSLVLSTFSNDLFKLLGITRSNEELNSPLSQIGSFKRLMIIENLETSITTLSSLVNMTNNLQQMSIPKEVLEDVNNALSLRLQIIRLLNNPELGSEAVWNEALILSNELVKICERAFFNKEMVQQMFFPQEHKIAVYLPLLGPITVVTFTGFIKYLKDVLKKREKNEKNTADLKEEKAD